MEALVYYLLYAATACPLPHTEVSGNSLYIICVSVYLFICNISQRSRKSASSASLKYHCLLPCSWPLWPENLTAVSCEKASMKGVKRNDISKKKIAGV